MKYYTPKHFAVQEYIPPEIYNALGDKSILLMDYRVLKTDDSIREHFGKPIIMNTWHNKKLVEKYGVRKYSGFRQAECTIGSVFSQHKYGRASDKIMLYLDIEEVRKEILKNQKHFPYITVIEDKVSWLHTDCRCIVDSEIQLINP